MTGRPSIVPAQTAVVDETFIRNSLNAFKLIVGIDARQLYPFVNASIFVNKTVHEMEV